MRGRKPRPRKDLGEDRDAFFKSVHGPLNHISVSDGAEMFRFTGEGLVQRA